MVIIEVHHCVPMTPLPERVHFLNVDVDLETFGSSQDYSGELQNIMGVSG